MTKDEASKIYPVCDDHGVYGKPCRRCAEEAWLEDHPAIGLRMAARRPLKPLLPFRWTGRPTPGEGSGK